MPRIKLISTNKKTTTVVAVIISLFGVITVLTPLLLMRFVPQSGIGNYVIENFFLLSIIIPILIYFLYTGIYYYRIEIDPYIINIRSYRTILGVFQSQNYIDIVVLRFDIFFVSNMIGPSVLL